MSRQYRFYKENGEWFIDLPKFPFDKAYLAMVQGADLLLDVLSRQSKEVTLQIDTKCPDIFDGVLEKAFSLGIAGGAIYNAKYIEIPNSFEYEGNEESSQLWLCPVTLWVFLRYPKKIYYKVIK